MIDNLERTFVDNLALIERILRALCVRNGFYGDDADDACSWAKLRIIESDYAVLRKFRGQSSLGRYLSVVLAMQMREYRVMLWGRWRPSAAAQSRGALAIRLETLVYRDKLTLQQAYELLVTSGETGAPFRDIQRLFADLPQRSAMRPHLVDGDAIGHIASEVSTDAALDEEQADVERAETNRLLLEALSDLGAEDQVMLRMRYWGGLPVADVARGLGVPQKPLYRRIEKALSQMRTKLEALGVSAHRFRDLLQQPMSGQPNGAFEPVRRVARDADISRTGPSVVDRSGPSVQSEGGSL